MLNSMGYMYLERGQVEDSLTCFDASIALNPEFDKPRVNRANALAALSRFDEAIAQVDSLLASNPNSFTWLQNRCLLLDKAGRGMEALEACDKSLLHTPGSAVGHNNLAWILRGLGRVDEAVAAFRQALSSWLSSVAGLKAWKRTWRNGPRNREGQQTSAV